MDKEIKILQHFISNGKLLKIYRDENNNIIIDGDILIYETEYKKFPVKIYKVNGNIFWHGFINGFKLGTLESLENFPEIVTGSVFIYKNPNLKTLKGCPKYIGQNLQCNNCDISDISDISEYIGQNLILENNPIKDASILEHIYIGNIVNLIRTNIKDVSNLKFKNDSSVLVHDLDNDFII